MQRRLRLIFLIWLGGSSYAFAQGWAQPYPSLPTYWEYVEKRPQFSVLTPEIDQIGAFAWVRPVTQIGETVVIVAQTSWLFNSDGAFERTIVGKLSVLRYSGYDAQGLNLERRETDESGTRLIPGKVNTVDDCVADLAKRHSYVVSARLQALFQCESGWQEWKPRWTPWQTVRLPKTGLYQFSLDTKIQLPMRLTEVESRLTTTVAAAAR